MSRRKEISADPIVEEKRRYHREYNLIYMKEWRKNNPEEALERERTWRLNNRLKTLINATKQTAKKRGLDHTITIDDLSQPTHCPILGVEIDWSVMSGKHMMNPSVDRIDPNIGYVPGNVEVMSSLANTMKCNATPEQLVVFSTEMLKRYGSNK